MSIKFYKAFIFACSAAILFSACGSDTTAAQSTATTAAPSETVSETTTQVSEATDHSELDSDETENISLVQEDMIQITDDNYYEIVDILNNLDVYIGNVYQFEGVLKFSSDGSPFVCRTLKDDEGEVDVDLPLGLLTENLKDGVWVRVTSILSEYEEGIPSFDVIAIETPDTVGEEIIVYNGTIPELHN